MNSLANVEIKLGFKNNQHFLLHFRYCKKCSLDIYRKKYHNEGSCQQLITFFYLINIFTFPSVSCLFYPNLCYKKTTTLLKEHILITIFTLRIFWPQSKVDMLLFTWHLTFLQHMQNCFNMIQQRTVIFANNLISFSIQCPLCYLKCSTMQIM